MNAQECKTLTATRMHDLCTCRSIASISQCVCLFNTELDTYTTYPAPEVLQFLGGGTCLCHYINWRPLWLLKLNYALESHCLFTLSLHLQLTSKAQNGNHSCTLLYHWNVTTLPWCLVILRCVLSLRRPLPYGRTDGQNSPNDCSNPPPTLCGEG